MECTDRKLTDICDRLDVLIGLMERQQLRQLTEDAEKKKRWEILGQHLNKIYLELRRTNEKLTPIEVK